MEKDGDLDEEVRKKGFNVNERKRDAKVNGREMKKEER